MYDYSVYLQMSKHHINYDLNVQGLLYLLC